jgi:VanZ family protein
MFVILLLHLVTGEVHANVDVPHFDKLVHFLMFTFLTYLMVIGFSKQDRYSKLRFKAPMFTILVVTAYAIIVESIQLFIPIRTFDSLDLVADLVGNISGYYLFVFVYKVL